MIATTAGRVDRAPVAADPVGLVGRVARAIAVGRVVRVPEVRVEIVAVGRVPVARVGIVRTVAEVAGAAMTGDLTTAVVMTVRRARRRGRRRRS